MVVVVGLVEVLVAFVGLPAGYVKVKVGQGIDDEKKGYGRLVGRQGEKG